MCLYFRTGNFLSQAQKATHTKKKQKCLGTGECEPLCLRHSHCIYRSDQWSLCSPIRILPKELIRPEPSCACVFWIYKAMIAHTTFFLATALRMLSTVSRWLFLWVFGFECTERVVGLESSLHGTSRTEHHTNPICSELAFDGPLATMYFDLRVRTSCLVQHRDVGNVCS